jgi:glycosyltransferase involved in cell wall biosynthesis
MICVLMSVYHREQPHALAQALESLCVQTEAPAEVVLVKDGPLGAPLEQVIDAFRQRLPLCVVALPVNVGLAEALNAGLRAVSQPWVMRFDSDDLCVPQRVQWQREAIEAGLADVIGGQIDEFEHDPSQAHQSRAVPLQHSDLVRFARRRNPFNHMTVCFRTDLVTSAGGYPLILWMEDYALWLTLMSRGARTMNLPQVLVHARVGNGMLARRGGWRYVRSEWRLQALAYRLGIKPLHRMLMDGLARSAVFLAPLSLRAWVYRTLLRRATQVAA